MAHTVIPRCGHPACAGCPVSVPCPGISIQLKYLTCKLRARRTLSSSAPSRLTPAGEPAPKCGVPSRLFSTLPGIVVLPLAHSFAPSNLNFENSLRCASAAFVPAGHRPAHNRQDRLRSDLVWNKMKRCLVVRVTSITRGFGNPLRAG